MVYNYSEAARSADKADKTDKTDKTRKRGGGKCFYKILQNTIGNPA